MNKKEVKKLLQLATSMGEDGHVLLALMAKQDSSFMNHKEFIDYVLDFNFSICATTTKLHDMDPFHKKNWEDAVWARAHGMAAQGLKDMLSMAADTTKYHVMIPVKTYWSTEVMAINEKDAARQALKAFDMHDFAADLQKNIDEHAASLDTPIVEKADD